MPAVRDFSQAYNSSTTQFLEVPMPAYEQGDLLIAVMSTDTGTQTWNGLDKLTSAQYDDGGAFTDYTTAANNTTAADVNVVASTPAVNDAFYVGSASQFTSAWFLFSTQGAGTWTITWEYWNGSWTGLSGVSDGTTSFKAATTGPVAVTYTMPTDWASTTVNSVSAYYIRGRVSAYTSISARPVVTFVQAQYGWQQLFSQTNTANLAVLYKTASATEVDTLFRYSVTETANGSIISIRDVDPIADTKTYVAVTINVSASAGTFTRTSGDFTTDGFVAGMAINTSGFTNGGNNAYKIIQSVSTTVITVTSNSGLVDESGNGNERVVSWPFGSSTGYAVSTAAAVTASMPTMTTDVDKCLLMFGAGNQTPQVPSIINGACQLIFGKDGATHSDGCSWGWQAAAGNTPAVGYTSMGTGATRTAVWAIRPPGAGATVVPGYTASDSSVYVSPFTGAGWGSDSATTNTITTTFTGTINGKSLTTGQTTTTIADTGLNSYHAMSYCAGVTTANSWAGTRTVIAARNNLAGKNILFHHQPYLPVDIQTTDSVSLTGVVGRAIGLASSAGHFIVWHVGGAFTSWGTQRHAPAVINTSATGVGSGVIQTTGSFNSASIATIGNLVSGRNVIPDWLIGSVWALDTTTIAGGSSAEPLSVEGIVAAYAEGHERRSAIRQGTGQMMLLGPIQFGNGGTDPIYLELDSTAIEFPRQYNKAKKEVFYNSIDNFAGITYYAGSGDVIRHKNSVITSPSKYHWKFHASSSTSGTTYDFSGLQVIGAGTVTLKAGITLTDTTWASCDNFDSVGATLTTCTIKDSIATSALNVTSTSNMALVTGCTFSGNIRAINLTTAGTYSSNGNLFSSNTYDIENSSAGTNADTYSESNQNATQALGNGTVTKVGQSFTGDGGTLANTQFYLSKTGSPTGNLVAKVYSHSGTFGTNSVPDTLLASSENFDVSTLNGSLALKDIFFIGEGRTTGDNNIVLTNTVKFVVTLEYSGGDGSNYVNVGVDTSSPGHGGNFSTYSGSWSAVSGTDACFRIRTGGIVVVNATNGSNPAQTKVINSNAIPGSTTINAAVNLTVTVLDSNTNPIPTAQVAMFKVSDDSQLMNEDTQTVTAGSFVVGVKYTIVSVGNTDFTLIGAASNTVGVAFTATGIGSGTGTASNGVATESFTYETDTPIYIRVRKSSDGETKYIPLSTTGTITSSGYSLTATLSSDNVA